MEETNFDSIIKAARQGHEPKIIDVNAGSDLAFAVPIAVVPTDGGGFAIANVKPFIDAYRERPERRSGTAKLDDLASFIAHACRFKDDDSAIFISGDPAKPSFLSVFDYHEAVNAEYRDADAEPRFGVHRGAYVPVFSEEWKAWTGAAGKGLDQSTFAALIESRARDIFDVTRGDDDDPGDGPSRLGEMARWFSRRFARSKTPSEFYADASTMLLMAEGLTATITDRVGDVARRDSGATRITFESERNTDVEIPAAFLIEVPVFRGGDLWQLPVRLRYTLRTVGETKRAEWKIEPFGVERTIVDVVKDMGETVAKATGLPVFVGAPET